MALQKPPIWLNDHFCQRSRPADCIRAGLQPWKLTVHVIIHQSCALIGFLQRGINDDAPGDALQFHNGRTDHEGSIPGACDRQNRLGVPAPFLLKVLSVALLNHIPSSKAFSMKRTQR